MLVVHIQRERAHRSLVMLRQEIQTFTHKAGRRIDFSWTWKEKRKNARDELTCR